MTSMDPHVYPQIWSLNKSFATHMVFGQCDASYGTLKDEENWKTCRIYHKSNFYDL